MKKQIRYAIDIKKLNKTFFNKKKEEEILALVNVSLQIPKGSLFGLLGLNGAGKSTIINILAGLCLKNSGAVKINNYDIDTNRKQASCQIGIVPQELNFDPFFTPKEILEVQAGLYGIKKKDRKTKQILQDLDLYKLLVVFQNAVEKFEKEKNKPPHKIEKYPYTIDEQKKFIINSLKSKEKISFVKLINDNPLKILVIYNFLAILELLQQVKIKISIGKGLNNFWLIKS